ncbi:MAG: BrnT family toxin [Aridibacter sp.]
MIFESDEIKANINVKTHGVTFAEAEEVFDDINSIESFDTLHSDEESRFRRIGFQANDYYSLCLQSDKKTTKK